MVSRLLALAVDVVVIILLGVVLMVVIAAIRALFTEEFVVEVSRTSERSDRRPSSRSPTWATAGA